MNAFDLFMAGGPIGMTIITVLLVLMFFAAWKAPAWVKEIGLAALAWSVFWELCGLFNVLDVLQAMPVEDYSAHVIMGGLKVTLIPIMYGLLVYLVSLVIRLVQKPRI